MGEPDMKSRFGCIEIRGTVYEYDVVIHTDGSVSKRSKKKSKKMKDEYGHTPLSESELEFLKKEHPEVVYVGTGQFGAMPVTSPARKILEDYTTIICPTPDLIESIADERRRHSAIIHVTC